MIEIKKPEGVRGCTACGSTNPPGIVNVRFCANGFQSTEIALCISCRRALVAMFEDENERQGAT